MVAVIEIFIVNARFIYIGVADYLYQRLFDDLIARENVGKKVQDHLIGEHINSAL